MTAVPPGGRLSLHADVRYGDGSEDARVERPAVRVLDRVEIRGARRLPGLNEYLPSEAVEGGEDVRSGRAAIE